MPVEETDMFYYGSKSTATGDGEATPDNLGKYRSSEEIVDATMENLFAKVTANESKNGVTTYKAIFIKNEHATLTLEEAHLYLESETPYTTLRTQLEASGSETTIYVYDNSAFPSKGAFFIGDEEITYTGKGGSGQACTFTGAGRGANNTTKVLHTVGTAIEDEQFRMAIEEPSAPTNGYIQLIGDENTDPTGLTFTCPMDYDTGIDMGDLDPGYIYGIWLRRRVPKGAWAVALINPQIKVEGKTDA